MSEYKYTDLMLATQSALLGDVVPSLRAGAIDWNNNIILIYFYNGGEISDELRDDYYCIGEEVVANFADADINEKIIRLDCPAQLPEHEYWVYRKSLLSNA